MTFPLKIPTFHTHYPRIYALLQSRPPCASPGHAWGGRGYLFRNFVFLNLTFWTCIFQGLCPFKTLSSEKPEICTFKLQVRKVELRRTNFLKRCPRPAQEWLALAQGGRDRNNAIIWGVIYLWIWDFWRKIILIHCIISLVIFFSIVTTFEEEVYQF